MPSPAEKKRRRVLLFKHGYRDPAYRFQSAEWNWTHDQQMFDTLQRERELLIRHSSKVWWREERALRDKSFRRHLAFWMAPIPFPDRVRP